MKTKKLTLAKAFPFALFAAVLIFAPAKVEAAEKPKKPRSAQKIDWRTVNLETQAYSPTGNGLSAFGGEAVLDPATYGVNDTKSAVAKLKYCGWVDKRRILAVYRHEARNGDKEAQFRYALMILRFAECGQECPEAIRMLELAAEQKFAPAIYVLALCHEKAIGCFVDHEKAAKRYSQLLDDPIFHEKATLGLAACLIEAKKFQEAEKLLQPLVARENAEALFLTYKLLLQRNGKGVGNAGPQEVNLLKRAHEQGSLDASGELGMLWLCKLIEASLSKEDTLKDNIIDDFFKFSKTMTAAINANHPEACLAMGLCYRVLNDMLSKSGAPPNHDYIQKARQFYQKSVEYGNVMVRSMASTYEYEAKDYERAFQLLRPGILKKDPGTLHFAGCMLLDGVGVKRDVRKAFEYLTMAKDGGWDAKECDKALQRIDLRELYARSPETTGTVEKSQSDDCPVVDFQIEPGSSFARLLDVLGTIRDSTDSFEALEQRLSRIKPTESNVGNVVVSSDEMSFLLTIFKLEFCSILRKGRKTIMYAEQLEWLLQNKTIDIVKLSGLLLGINLEAMKEIGLARAEIIKGTPENAIPKIKGLLASLSPSSPEYYMAKYTLGCLYFMAGKRENCFPLFKDAVMFFVRNGLISYTAIATNRMALTCSPFDDLKSHRQWRDYSDVLACRTNSTLVNSEALLQILWTYIIWYFAPDEIKTLPHEEKQKIMSEFEATKKEFLCVATSDYYLLSGYLYCAEFELAFGYPTEMVLGDIEKIFMYHSLVFEAAGEYKHVAVSIAEELKNRALKILAETNQPERLHYWNLQFEKLRIRDRRGTDKMSMLAKMVSRLENANQIIALEESKPPEQQDQKLLAMAREVKKELEGYFDSVKYRLDEADRKKLEKIQSDSFVIDPKTMRRLRDDLPEGVACVQIIPAGDSVVSYIVSHDKPPLVNIVSLSKLGSSGKKLTNLIITTRTLLAQGGDTAQVQEYLQSLYVLLWQEMEPPLQRMKITKVMVNGSGVLRYLPFAALYDGRQYLVEKYQVTNMTGLDSSQFAKSAEAKRFPDISAVIFADPDGSLPAARVEGKHIAGMFQKHRYYAGEKASLGEFESLLRSSSTRVNFIHLATHAFLDPNAPEDSYVLFAHGDKWCYGDMNDFSVKGVDSFVLSACSTAVGEKSTGSEIEGMAYNLLCNSSAGSVLASFWRVNDEATAKLMSIYYKHVTDSIKATHSLDRGGALRDAQLKLLRNPDTSHPYYWAAFTLFGDFR